RTVTVVQAAAYFLSISTERLDFASDAGHSSFTISSNAPWSTTIDAAWLSVTPATGSNSATLTVSVLANTTTNPRRGEITVSGGGITRTLLVSQHAAEAILTVSQPSLTFAAGAGNAIVNLISNVTWAISDDAEWITLSAASGSNNATIAISVTANPLSSVRSGIITITGGGLTRTISVSQAASALSLTVSPPSLTFGAGAGSTTFTLSANVPWSASDDAVWITLSPASGTKDTTVAVTVTANPSTSSRSGTVTLTGGGITRTVAISQSGESAVLTTSLTTLPFSAGAGSATFSVTSNVSWSVSEDAAWISISPVSATYNATVTLTVLANPSTASRSATVNVSGGGVARTITVNQSGAAAVLTVAPVSLSFGAGAGSSTFGITSNLSWSVSDDAPWLSASPASGARDTTVTVTVAANTTTTPRSGTLSITGGGITRSVTVTQSAAAAILTASTTSLIFSASSGSAGFTVSSNISWSASADAAWLTVSPASGTGDSMMTVAVTANPTVNPRSALVVITGGGITRNVAVTQSAGAAAITLSRSAIPFGADAATAELEVTANISWSASDDAAWLMVSPAAAPNDTTVTVTALANPATSARTATVTFTGGGVVRMLTVTQAGSAANLSVNPAGLSFAAGAASAPLAVTANVAWSADDNAPWVTLSPAGGSRDTTVTVMVTANPTTSSRSATVTITGGGMSRSVAINQSAAAAL
ncbi:MAG TPA: BACON domain-containing protein, partial [bacterium]|nr:BACON domain-containing protein [bacterium]